MIVRSNVRGMRGKLFHLSVCTTTTTTTTAISHTKTKQLHALLLTSHTTTLSTLLLLLLRSYAAHGDFPSAHRLLDQTPHPTSPLLYNALIRAHARGRRFPDAFALFARMRRSNTSPDAHTFACILRACSDSSDSSAAKMAHALVLSSGFSSHSMVGSALVSAYSKLGLIDDARRAFDGLRGPDLVLWNSMMSGYGYRGLWRDGLDLFRGMQGAGERPDGYSLVGLVSCFSDPQAVAFGRAVHGLCVKGGYDSGHHVRSALVSMYLRCGCVESGCNLFHDLSEPDLVTWSSLITGLLQAGNYEESLDLFRDMNFSGKRPDGVLIASVLSACASMAMIGHSKEIHCYALRLGADTDIKVSSALMDTYAKCGFTELGYRVFRLMPDKNSVMYNTVISNLGSHGFATKAIEVLEEMLREELRPDGGTFSALLAACCHSGLLDEGWKLFRRMRDEFLLVVNMEHYVYMVRLLAASGQLKEAYDLIQTMPMPADCGVWGALLWGCCVHRDANLGRIVAERLFELYPDKTAYRVMLSNLYASNEMWWDVEDLRGELPKEATHKNPGISWVGDGRA